MAMMGMLCLSSLPFFCNIEVGNGRNDIERGQNN
jgi:hypothetical protein